MRIAATRRLALGFLLTLAAACYDPDPIDWLQVSPDGRYAAMIHRGGDLRIMDLAEGGSVTTYSHHAEWGCSWSPDSTRLVFVERVPNSQPALWLVQPVAGRDGEPLVEDIWWKGRPAWLDQDRVVFLSPSEFQNVDVWAVDVSTRASHMFIDRDTDILGLWSGPGGELVFETCPFGRPELWSLTPGGDEPVLLSNDLELMNRRSLAFSPDGRKVAFVVLGPAGRRLARVDRGDAGSTTMCPIEAPPRGLAILDDGQVAAAFSESLLMWRPAARWYQREQTHVDLDGLSPSHLTSWGRKGLALVVNENVVLTADKPRRPADGHLHSQRHADLLAISYARAEHGQWRAARRLLDQLWKAGRKGSRSRYQTAQAYCRIEQMAGRPRRADRWAGRALVAAPRGSEEELTARSERLALACFDRGDLELTRWLLRGFLADGFESPLTRWVTKLWESPDSPETRHWVSIARDLRRGRTARAALDIHRAFDQDRVTTLSREGLALVLGGDLDPLAGGLAIDWNRTDELLADANFQIALLKASRIGGASDPAADDIRARLQIQWVRDGNYDAARELTAEHLAQSESTGLDYLGVLRNYLAFEETEQWMKRAVTEVLLHPKVESKLLGRLTSPGGRRLLRLVKTKAALVGGDVEQAQAELEEAKRLSAASLADVGASEHFLLALYQAKIHERRGAWDQARAAYRAALEQLEREPESWSGTAGELVKSIGLLASGSGDPEQLVSYLGALRGLGDPLIDPAHDPRTLRVGIENIQTLLRFDPAPWLAPHLAHGLGACYASLGQAGPALTFFGQARRLDPPAPLLQRILTEEAALRESLGQHALAAHLHGRVYRMDTSVAVRSQAVMAAIQAETYCGATLLPETRLMELQATLELPDPWFRWLGMQLGLGVGAE